MLLVGFMGSGKTTVGRELAAKLGWSFVDFDDAVTSSAGMSVAEIFRVHGEDHFRALEAEAGRRLLERKRVVLAAGGGWAAAPGRLEGVPAGTATFWLRVSPDEAIRRARDQPGLRPLLVGDDASDRAARLLAEREPRYARAAFAVDTDGRSVDDVTTEILGILATKHPAVPRTEVE